MAYLPNGLAVQYHGTWTQSAIVRFVRALMSPLRRFTTPDQLLQVAVGSDAVVLAFVDLQTNRSQYQVFFQAAVKWLERDPYQEIVFGVVTGESARLFGVTDQLPAIRMYAWNETLEYNGNRSWTQPGVNKWVVEHIQQVSLWLSPPGTKSTSFAPYLKQGPVLVVFTPRNLYAAANDAYATLRQIGMEYYNCPRDDWVREMARDYIPHQRHENRAAHDRLVAECRALNRNRYNDDGFFGESFGKCHQKSVSVTFAQTMNTSKAASSIDHHPTAEYCDLEGRRGTKDCVVTAAANCNKYCGAAVVLPESQRQSSYIKRRRDDSGAAYETSMLNSEFDQRSPESLRHARLVQLCDFQTLSDSEAPTLFFNGGDDDQQNLETVSGMACEMNKTFSLIAIDSLVYHTFAERLGVDLLALENKSAAFIIDPDNESTYLLGEPLSTRSLSNFLVDFHRRVLPSFRRTGSLRYRHTHFFRTATAVPKPQSFEGEPPRRSLDVTIKEVYAEDFEETVIKSNKVGGGFGTQFFFNGFSLKCFCFLLSLTIRLLSLFFIPPTVPYVA